MPVSRNALASAVHGDIFIVRFSAFEGRRLVAPQGRLDARPGTRREAADDPAEFEAPDDTVAARSRHPATRSSPPLALAAFIFPGITGCGARGEHHQCCRG